MFTVKTVSLVMQTTKTFKDWKNNFYFIEFLYKVSQSGGCHFFLNQFSITVSCWRPEPLLKRITSPTACRPWPCVRSTATSPSCDNSSRCRKILRPSQNLSTIQTLNPNGPPSCWRRLRAASRPFNVFWNAGQIQTATTGQSRSQKFQLKMLN